MLQVGRGPASRCKGLFFKNDSDHRCMHVVEQVRGKVSGSQQVGSTRNHRSCLVHGLNDGNIAGMVGFTSTAVGLGGFRDQVNGSLGVISRDLITTASSGESTAGPAPPPVAQAPASPQGRHGGDHHWAARPQEHPVQETGQGRMKEAGPRG